MGAVHSTPGAYIPVPGGSPVVLKGVVKKFRLAEGISHLRGS